MSSGERPLLARPNSESSHEAEEEDALLTGQPTRKSQEQTRKWREMAAWVWSAASTVVIVILAIAFSKERSLAEELKRGGWTPDEKPHGKRNMIFMVSDGMGPASLELARTFRQYTNGLPIDDVLTLDQHLIGTSRTRSSSSIITDSAAGATAFSCGFKTYNTAISVLPDHTPCGTVLEAAKKAGYMTGLVVTTSITDATPACFASHVQTRGYQDLIAEQLLGYYPLGRMVDVLIGGGRCHFLPNTTEGSCRADDTDLVGKAVEDGWNYIDSMDDFNNLDPKGGVKLPMLALMADRDIPFEIDRRYVQDDYPSQYDMATLALEALKTATIDSDKGFFLMIEGSRVDHAGHDNDPGAQVHEVLMHDSTFGAALEFLDHADTPGILVSTSDHETGGLSAAQQLGIAYPQYIWYPEVLANCTHSANYVAQRWINFLQSKQGGILTRAEKTAFIKDVLQSDLNIGDATDEEVDTIIDNGDNGFVFTQPPKWILGRMISRRALVGWSTHGHSGVDVNIYGSHSDYVRKVAGNVENIEIGKFMAKYLDVDVDAVTKELIEKGVGTNPNDNVDAQSGRDWTFPWTGKKISPEEAEVLAMEHWV